MANEFTRWHKSTYSGGGENCVTQGTDRAAQAVGIADTKMGDTSPVLAFSGNAWTAFVADLTTGDAA